MVTFYKYPLLFLALVLLLGGCFENSVKEKKAPSPKLPVKQQVKKVEKFTGKSVPVLCYHVIRELSKKDSPNQKTYSVSPENFALQIKTLADNGYTTITPDELNAFLTKNRPLPKKPIMITFDDGSKAQYTIGATILNKYHFKGVFFIMTVAIDKEHYMSQSEIKTLSDNGHIIGCHTWDHHKVSDYKKEDWQLQIAKPKKQLEKITKKPVTSFAYPYGVWNSVAADSIKKFGFTTAFTIYTKQDVNVPLYTLPRIIVQNSFKMDVFLHNLEKSQKENSL
jgi:peptidoglycan/xylan/chitin deacetylase (PgdA/CDA1 family)